MKAKHEKRLKLKEELLALEQELGQFERQKVQQIERMMGRLLWGSGLLGALLVLGVLTWWLA